MIFVRDRDKFGICESFVYHALIFSGSNLYLYGTTILFYGIGKIKISCYAVRLVSLKGKIRDIAFEIMMQQPPCVIDPELGSIHHRVCP